KPHLSSNSATMKYQLALGLLLCAVLAVAASPNKDISEEEAEAIDALEALSQLEDSEKMEERAAQPQKKWRIKSACKIFRRLLHLARKCYAKKG
ncbi:hypothetical protein BOX15_Mlig020420g1, partial [Macrostomum lignano]